MSSPVETIVEAQSRAARIRPRVGGFPHLAEVLRQAGVERIHCNVPAMSTVNVTAGGDVVQQGTPQVSGTVAIAPFDEGALITALRTDQAGASTYPEFMAAVWRVGVVTYDIDLAGRTCTYRSAAGAQYVEQYPAVRLAEASG
jgi:uncharacterized protein YbcV (DUF1398 family)